jgi:spore coat protein CotH
MLILSLGGVATAQPSDNESQSADGPTPRESGQTNLHGAPFGSGGPFGMPEDTRLVNQFDQDRDGRLNAEERKAALAFVTQQNRTRNPGGPPGGPAGSNRSQTPQPGPKLSPTEVKSFPGVPLYDAQTVRTFFLEFEDPDWEKELAAFHRTDVEVPAKLTVDGRTYRDIGVHFHGMSSFMMVGEGQKRSLVLTLDFVHPDQELGGYRKLMLLNSHEDSSFLRTVLALEIARDYLPAPQANFARVVINGECWGIYVNQQHFNKDFAKQWFGTTKGARWKIIGSPDGRGGMNYLGEDAAAYKRIYTIKTKDDPAPWSDLIKLCKVLNETPADKLEAALAPRLDIDGALRFFAWENALANGDGFWTRASDYDLYEDKSGRFHIVPYDANETFSLGGGPGGSGGPGPGGFGPGMFIAPQLLAQADKNGDQKLARVEFLALADSWFDQLVTNQTEPVNQEQFAEKIMDLLPLPGPPGMGGQRRANGPGGFDPSRFLGQGLFTAMDASRDGSLTRTELKATFGKWFDAWDAGRAGSLNEEQLRAGLNAVLPRPNSGGPGGRPGGPGSGGPELDPLVAANDTSKPLLSKLLAVPALRARYLDYVRDLAEKWLDWNRLGPLAEQYHALIAGDVRADTRKLDSTEAFRNSVTNGAGLKTFAEKRRAFLLNHTGNKPAGTRLESTSPAPTPGTKPTNQKIDHAQ